LQTDVSRRLDPPGVVTVIGAGPRGTGLLERLCANVPSMFADRPLEIHLVDPFTVGAGRIWRHDQSPLLKMNSMAEDVTMFTDGSSTIDGPVTLGPTLAEWAACAPAAGLGPPEVNAEVLGLGGMSFPTRLAGSQYLSWVFRRTVAAAPENVAVQVHPYRAVDLRQAADGRQEVILDGDGGVVRSDVVILALGHLSSGPDAAQARLATFAEAGGLLYIPPEHTADLDLTGIGPGEDVIVRGMGLAFIDLMVLLTEGRGGVFSPRSGGGLDYRPSGREPRLHVGSRRGVPYHSKIGYRPRGGPSPLPTFFDAGAVSRVFAAGRPVSLTRDFWPLAARDLAFAYYHELFTGHPGRTAMPWDEFAARFRDGERLPALVEAAVPAPEDRLDLDALDRPLRGLRFADTDDLQRQLREYIADDLRRANDDHHSPAIGIFNALLSAVTTLLPVLAHPALTARARSVEFGEFFSLFSYLASGPPSHRLEQLLALSRAGLVRFLGAGMRVAADPGTGRFVAGGAGTTATVSTRVLVEARLPRPSLSRCTDPLLRALHARGEVSEEVLLDGDTEINTGRARVNAADGRLLDAAGAAHPRRFAFGAHTNGFSIGAFPRPRTDAPFFRQNDAAARRILALLRDAPRPATGHSAGAA
jgi:FAD-NAD(P)-binding